MQDFRNLAVWHKAHRLTLETYAISAKLAHPKDYYLRDQLVKTAISIPANIAEGCGRSGDVEFRRFVRVSLGSASELEYHLLLARELGLVPEPAHERLAAMTAEVKRMLSGLVASLSTGKRS